MLKDSQLSHVKVKYFNLLLIKVGSFPALNHTKALSFCNLKEKTHILIGNLNNPRYGTEDEIKKIIFGDLAKLL